MQIILYFLSQRGGTGRLRTGVSYEKKRASRERAGAARSTLVGLVPVRVGDKLYAALRDSMRVRAHTFCIVGRRRARARAQALAKAYLPIAAAPRRGRRSKPSWRS